MITGVTIDDAVFQRNLQRYIEESSKSVIDAINWKLYDGSRAALKGTPKADKNTIKSKLNEASSKYPERTVAEMLVLKQMQATGQEVFDLQQEVKNLLKKKTSHTGFAKSGWLPAIRDLINKVGKSMVSVSGVTSVGYGGAQPAVKTGSTIQGSIYNDVKGTGNFAFVQKIKEIGGEQAKVKINSDIVTYLSKKLDIPIDKFNRS